MSNHLKRGATTPTEDNSMSPSTSSAPQKRRRVSRACDACRKAKEKCDGARPQCGRCITQKRRCGYSSPEKKRGIRTGYLRAIELALGLLLERDSECEKILLDVLHDHEEGRQDFLVDKEAAAGEQLREKWQKSRIYRGIDKLVSREDGVWAQLVDESEEETERNHEHISKGPISSGLAPWSAGQDASSRAARDSDLPHHRTATNITIPSSSKIGGGTTLKLPRDYRHLLDVYFKYTYCWFPVVEQSKITHLAESYPPLGLPLEPGTKEAAAHSELWGAMALSALQTRSIEMLHSSSHYESEGPNIGDIDPEYIYDVARRLIATKHDGLHPSSAPCLLLLSLARLEQCDLNGAWTLTGMAVRQYFMASRPPGAVKIAAHLPDSLVFMACCLIDTLLSLRLQRPAHMRPAELEYVLQSPSILLGDSPSDFGLSADSSYPHRRQSSKAPTSSPFSALYQQFRFVCILSKHLGPHHQLSSSNGISIAELVQALEAPFQFCNSLIDGGLTPKIPSAFLVHAAFLSSSSMLTLVPRPHLIGNLIDITEGYVSQFGPGTSPPLLRLYLELGSRTGHAAHLQPPQSQRLQQAIDILLRDSSGSTLSHDKSRDSYPSIVTRDQSQQTPATIELSDLEHVGSASLAFGDTPQTPTIERSWVESPLMAQSISSVVVGSAQSEGFTSIGGGMESQPSNGRHDFLGGSVDYDHILDELASLDYADSVEPDPQFMVNLGFAPGCEPSDLLGGKFPIF